MANPFRRTRKNMRYVRGPENRKGDGWNMQRNNAVENIDISSCLSIPLMYRAAWPGLCSAPLLGRCQAGSRCAFNLYGAMR